MMVWVWYKMFGESGRKKTMQILKSHEEGMDLYQTRQVFVKKTLWKEQNMYSTGRFGLVLQVHM